MICEHFISSWWYLAPGDIHLSDNIKPICGIWQLAVPPVSGSGSRGVKGGQTRGCKVISLQKQKSSKWTVALLAIHPFHTRHTSISVLQASTFDYRDGPIAGNQFVNQLVSYKARLSLRYAMCGHKCKFIAGQHIYVDVRNIICWAVATIG